MQEKTLGDRFETDHLSLSVDVKEVRKSIAASFYSIPEIVE